MIETLTEELAGVRYRELRDPGAAALANPAMRTLLSYWQEKCVGEALPFKHAIDPAEFHKALGRIMVLERLDDGDYFYRLYGARAAETTGYDLTGQRLRDTAGPSTGFFASKYDLCLESRRPLYTLHKTVRLPSVVLLERLMLPFADRDGAARFIVAYMMPLEMSGVPEPHVGSRMA